MTVEDFQKKQTEILEGIKARGNRARIEGLVSTLPERGLRQTGYLVYLTFSPSDVGPIEDFSMGVDKAVSGRTITYGRHNVHQTIADYGIETSPESNIHAPDERVLRALSIAAAKGLEAFAKWAGAHRAQINTVFGNYINSPDSVILNPLGNVGNYELIEEFGQSADREGLKVRKAWGTHVTVNRFTEQITPLTDLASFNRAIGAEYPKSYPNASNDGDPIFPTHLNVGYFVADRNAFRLVPIQSSSLNLH